jgi:hypothetical protein
MADCKIESQRGTLFDWNVTDSWELGKKTEITEYKFKRLCDRDTLKVSAIVLQKRSKER